MAVIASLNMSGSLDVTFGDRLSDKTMITRDGFASREDIDAGWLS